MDLDEVINAFDAGHAALAPAHRRGARRRPGRARRRLQRRARAGAAARARRRERVAANLADPRTGLDGAVRGVESTVAELAPVASQLGSLVAASDTTAGALASVSARAAAEIISDCRRPRRSATRALGVARPVLPTRACSCTTSGRARACWRAPPPTCTARSAIGIPVVRRALGLSERLRTALAAVDTLASDPLTRGALDRLLLTLRSALPTLRFVVPGPDGLQLPRPLDPQRASTISEGDDSGTWFRTLVVAGVEEFTARADARAEPAPEPVRQHGRAGPGARVRDRQRAVPAGPADRPRRPATRA